MINIEYLATATKEFTILFVDDEEKSRTQTIDLLSVFFKNILIASNGIEALDIYSKNKNNIDIIFTDIGMPQMDGIELSTQIKKMNPIQYIVTISAHQNIEFYNQAINIGIDGMIIKPITSEKILTILSKAVDKICYINDIKNQNNNSEQFIEDQEESYKDPITGLINKIFLDRYLNNNNKYTAILVNIDNFDIINCTYGYYTGDQVLKQMGQFLQSLIKTDQCKLFRVVSDEFLFLVSDQITKEKIEKFSKDIIQTLDSIKIKTQIEEFQLSCTIGISSGSGFDIVREAHIAVKEARQIGKHKYYFFSNNSQIIQQKENNLKWLSKIKKVLKEDSLIPYYQPIVDNKTNQVVIHESLARILELNRVIKPYYFLENAKLFNLTPNLSKIMISKVFEYCNNNNYKVSINIFAEDLMIDSFSSFIVEQLAKYKLKAKNIIIEVFEDITINKNKTVLNNINFLHKKGFKIALDDFGVNDLNISKLHSIPIDYIKIDASFIETILEDKKSLKVVESIIKLSNNIGAKTIAESVSSKEIFDKVKELGVDYSQGYYIGKPKEFIE